MSKPAVIRAEFTDYRPVKTRKTVILSFEIPAEEQGAAFAALGYPVSGTSIWCAIARLQEGAGAPGVPEKAVEPARVEKAKPLRSPSQIAALKCHEHTFQEWLFETMGHLHTQEPTAFLTDEDYADAILKEVLGITSKRELDTMLHKAEAWNKLLTSFEYRNQVRA